MKRKILSAILGMSLVLGLASVGSFAAETNGTTEETTTETTEESATSTEEEHRMTTSEFLAQFSDKDGDGILDLTPEEEEIWKEYMDANFTNTVYSSEWGEDAEADWSGVETNPDVYIDEDNQNDYGTLSMKAGVHEDVMADCDSITIKMLDSDGNEAYHALNKINGYMGNFSLLAGTYTITDIIPTGYEGEYDISVSATEVTIEAGGATTVTIQIAPKEVEEEVVTEPEPVEEEESTPVWPFVVGGIVVVGIVAIIVVWRKNNKLN